MAVGAAALPWLIGGGAAASGVGSIMGARAGQPKMIDSPAPNPLFPQLNQMYTQRLGAEGPRGIDTLSRFAANGMPTDVSKTFESLVAAQQRLIGQGRAGLREQFGARGLSHSSSFAGAAVDFENQTALNFANVLSQLLLQTQESAAQRQLAAGSQLAEMFSSAGSAFTPSAVLSTGGQSSVGAGFSSIGNSISTLALLRSAGLLGKAA